ncbi:MAG TPA: PP2C family protein-serine/threonine phosphatase [Pilimelia sp.]|nr:PP2C family protein-serine/threonine phosphatase [Pilimelia sp.]
MSDPMEAVRCLLDLRNRGRPEDLPAALAEVAPFLDAVEVGVLLVDYEQISLWPLRDTRAADARAADARVGAPTALVVDGTAAGRAFSTGEVVHDDSDEGLHLWLPLLHGAERLGVLSVRTKAEPDERLHDDLRVIAALVAELIASRRFYGDAVEHTRRKLPMQLAAEIIWNQLPPLTFAANDAIVTAVLEPAYDVGGDAFDYAANGDMLHFAIFDTVGHGIAASALTTLALNTYRNGRRSGLSLADTYRSIDKWIRAQHPGAFVTALMVELDTETGRYQRIAAGHPAELLLRDGKAVGSMKAPTALPLGLGHMLRRGPGVTEQLLEPGDTLAFYTDGITEARSADGNLFGLDRLTAFVSTAVARRLPPAEIMRQLIHTIVSYENGELRDDATAALLQWRPRT